MDQTYRRIPLGGVLMKPMQIIKLIGVLLVIIALNQVVAFIELEAIDGADRLTQTNRLTAQY